MNDLEMVLIIPVFNGEFFLERTLRELDEFSVDNRWLKEVLFVDDGSVDNTFKILSNWSEKQHNFKVKITRFSVNRGKGEAVKAAVFSAEVRDLLAFTDVDLPYGLSPLKEARQIFLEDSEAKMVTGDRFLKGEKDRTALRRRIGRWLFRGLLPKDAGLARDTQCGFKVFKFENARQIFSLVSSARWTFDVEIFLILAKEKNAIRFVPVSRRERDIKTGGISFFGHGLAILKEISVIHDRFKKGLYEKT